MASNDKAFTGSIPKIYESYLVPLIFNDYAADLARRVTGLSPSRVLEIAAGTGVLTRALASMLPPSAAITATDLNAAMIEEAKLVGTARTIEWQPADAMQLPFPDQSFDIVVSQFGVMFFPDKARAHTEARRVLRPGGTLIFAVWDRVETNEVADAVTAGLARHFPDSPPQFLPRAPYGYYDHEALKRDLAAGGFDAQPSIEIVPARGRAKAAANGSIAFCQGTPLRGEIEARGPLEAATAAATAEVEARFGPGPIDTKIQAIIVTVKR